jgi:hypothetical protein
MQANYFKNDADAGMADSDAAFQIRVNNAPVPSASCCIDARAYTQYVRHLPLTLHAQSANLLKE